MLDADPWDNLPSMSYTSSNTGSTYSLGNAGGLTANITTAGGLQQLTTSSSIADAYQNYQKYFSPILGTPSQNINIVEKIVARLIRYTVVDPNPKLADVKPEMCILMQGTAMLNGADDKGFLMELAPKIAEKLDAHNKVLTYPGGPVWEDKDGKTHSFKTRRLSNFDVVVETLKVYN